MSLACFLSLNHLLKEKIECLYFLSLYHWFSHSSNPCLFKRSYILDEKLILIWTSFFFWFSFFPCQIFSLFLLHSCLFSFFAWLLENDEDNSYRRWWWCNWRGRDKKATEACKERIQLERRRYVKRVVFHVFLWQPNEKERKTLKPEGIACNGSSDLMREIFQYLPYS